MRVDINDKNVEIKTKQKSLSIRLDDIEPVLDKVIKDDLGKYNDCFSLHQTYVSETSTSVVSKKRRKNLIKIKLGVLPESYSDKTIRKISFLIIGNRNHIKLDKNESIKLIANIFDKESSEKFVQSLDDRIRFLETERMNRLISINNRLFKLKNVTECLMKSLDPSNQRLYRLSPSFQVHTYKSGLNNRICLICSESGTDCICLRSLYSNPLYVICKGCLDEFGRKYLEIDRDLTRDYIIKNI